MNIYFPICGTFFVKDGKVECLVCGMILTGLGRLKSHYKDHGSGPYNCLVCDKIFSDISTLTHHYQSHPYQRNKKLQKSSESICLLCGETFSNSHTLKLHYKTHGEGPYTCAHCGEIVNDLKHSIYHIKRHKENNCVICDKTFPTLRTMIEHRVLHGDGPYSCKICGKERLYLKDLYKHIRNHREKDLVQCKLCPKNMKKTKLKAHMGYHTGRLFNF